MKKNFKNVLIEEHSGAVAFEYIIILVIMAVALFNGFRMLQQSLETKANNVATFIDKNGQESLSNGSHSSLGGH